MNLQLPDRHLNVSQKAAVFILMAFLSFAFQPASAEHIVMPDGQTMVNCLGIGECGYINMHNRPTGSFLW
jgi:hypothetical protein